MFTIQRGHDTQTRARLANQEQPIFFSFRYIHFFTFDMEHASPRTFSTSNVIVYLYVEAMFEFDSVFRIDYACILRRCIIIGTNHLFWLLKDPEWYIYSMFSDWKCAKSHKTKRKTPHNNCFGWIFSNNIRFQPCRRFGGGEISFCQPMNLWLKLQTRYWTILNRQIDPLPKILLTILELISNNDVANGIT